MCHVEGSEVVDAHGDFEVLLRPVIRRYEDACVVDQHVQRRAAVQKLV